MRPKADLRPYQDRLVQALRLRDELITVVPMGGGKTAATLTAIADDIAVGNIRHALVLAPKRVAAAVWPDEVSSWEHLRGLDYVLVTGSPAKRVSLLTKEPRQITIVGIDNVQWLVDQLEQLPHEHWLFDCLVVDEISRFKNPKSKRLKALMRIARRFSTVWGLTGTIRPNGHQDLFGPALLTTRGKLWGKSFYKWRQAYFFPTDYNGYTWAIFPHLQYEVEEAFGRIALTLDPSEMPGLPELNIVEHFVDLPGYARSIYRDMQKTLMAQIDSGAVTAVNAAVATGKLCQISNGFLYDEDTEPTLIHHSKEEWLQDLVEDLNGEPLIIVYEFQADLEMLKSWLPNAPVIGGGTNEKNSLAIINQWNRGELPVLVIHPYAAGHGLNLQFGGRQMAFISPPWSAEAFDQTIKRVHRPGQKEAVNVHICMARDTIDEAKRARVVDKMTMQEVFNKYLRRV